MTNPKKNGDLMLRVRYDSGAELAGPAVITDEGALLVSLGGAASMLVQRADGSLPPHITFVDIRPSHVGYGLPLTDDMAYMAVTAMLRDAVGLPLNEAADSRLAEPGEAGRDREVGGLPVHARIDPIACEIPGP